MGNVMRWTKSYLELILKGDPKIKTKQGILNMFSKYCVYVFINFKSNLIWDDRLWTNCTNLTDDCSRKSKVTKRMRKNQN